MKVGIMQPYFFPYIGYFSLIKYTDKFILFDPVQFIKHGWIERNRILKQGGGWMYIAVPLEKHPRETLIKDIQIREEPWKEKIFSQLTAYKKRAPYYKETLEVITKALDIQTKSITHLNHKILKVVCEYLDIPFESYIFSEMNLTIEQPHAPDEWALNICKSLGNVDEYVNPPGGLNFFNRDKYEKAGIKLLFQQPILTPYSQCQPFAFEEGLSIVDVMMFNSKEQINKMLDNYTLL